MRQYIGKKQEEVFIFIFLNKFESLVLYQVLGVRTVASVVITRKLNTLVVFPKMVGIVIVCQQLAIEAIEIIHPLLIGISFRTGRA